MDAPAPPELPDTCAFDICTTYPDLCDLADDDAWGATKRDIEMGLESRFDEVDSDFQFYHVLEERSGRPRQFQIILSTLTAKPIVLTAWKYPGVTDFPAAMQRAGLSIVSYAVGDNCGEVAIQVGTAVAASALASYTVEHPLDLQLIKYFIISILTNKLSGSAGDSQWPAIPVEWVLDTFINDKGLPVEATNQVSATSPKNLRSPMKLIFEAFGSNTNLFPFLLMEKGLNIVKGAFFGLREPIKTDIWKELVTNALDNPELVREWASWLKWSTGVFVYLQQDEAWVRFRSVELSIRAQLVIIAKYIIGAVDLVDKWDEWFDSHMIAVQDFAQTWVKDRIIDAMTIVDHHNGPYYSEQMIILMDYLSQVGNIWIPGYKRTGS